MRERKPRPFRRNEREDIKARDNYEPQLRHYDEEEGWVTRRYCIDPENPCTDLQVHHVKPRGVGGQSVAENGILLGGCEHIGRCKDGRIHPKFARRFSNGKKRK